MAIKEIVGGVLKEKFKDAFYSQEAEVKGVMDEIQPVVELDKPTVDIVRNATASGTIYTCPEEEDFFLTGLYLWGCSTAAAETNKEVKIAITLPNGDSHDIGMVVISNATFGVQDKRDISFSVPIRLARASTVTVTAGAQYNRVVITGFTKASQKKT